MTQDPRSVAAQRRLDVQARGASHHEVRSCLRKRSYHTRKLAREATRKVRGEEGEKLHVYRCPHCGLFHLTKRKLGT